MNCPKCHTKNRADAKFCNECGKALNPALHISKPTPIREAERKRITALFSDLSGYTAMTVKLDPEEVKEITSRIFDGSREIIKKYEGFIERFAGDGFLVLFGVPKAHGDDPVRAIRTAAEIHQFVASLSPLYQTKVGHALTMHSGINTGLAVTADVDPEKGTHGVTGEAVNLGARLSDFADPGDILVGAETYRASQSLFTFEALKPVKVKGKSEPIPIYKLMSDKVSNFFVSIGRQVFSEMVGRDRELVRLELLVMKAIKGEGSVVNVVGEAGIGKSRLMAELKKRDVMQQVILLEGRSISIGKNLSFHPIIDLLKQWAHITEDDTEMQAFSKLERGIQAIHLAESDEILPFVATLMGIKLHGRHEERVRGIEGEALEKLILKNFRDLIVQGSELRPTVIVMEDLHWADTSSLELLQSLYRLTEKNSLIFINVFRPGYLEEDAAKATAQAHERIEIQPLATQDSETMINNMIEIKGLPFSFKAQILDRAGGNPFFIEEIVRSLIDDGAVVRGRQGFEVTGRIDRIEIPSTINEVLMARIDRLEKETRELVRVASVIGRNFFDRILRDVVYPTEGVDDRLSHLKNMQLIRERRRLEELEYLFCHALAQEAAYNSILLEQRKIFHLKVAQSIEKIFQKRLNEFYGMLAHHYGVAGKADKAEEYLKKAGEEALKSSASSEALQYYKDALELYIRTYGDRVDSDRIAEYEENIAFALYFRGYHAEAIPYFDKVLNRLGIKEPKKKLPATIKIVIGFIFLLKNLYAPSFFRKKIPTELDIRILKLSLYKGWALGCIDARRPFLSTLWGGKKAYKFDLASSEIVFRASASLSNTFSWTGISFRISRKILNYVKNYISETDNKEFFYFYQIAIGHEFLVGNWSVELNNSAIDYYIRIGAILDAAYQLSCQGFIYLELGEFGKLKNIIEWLKKIGDDFNDEGAMVIYYSVNSLFLKKLRKLDESITFANKCMDISKKIGQRDLYDIIIWNSSANSSHE